MIRATRFFLASIALGSVVCYSEDLSQGNPREARLRADGVLVRIPVSVVDKQNRPVPGLDHRHFRIFEDRKEQTIASVWQEESPVSAGLVFDTSSSMAKKLSHSRQAASLFLKHAAGEDEFLLVEFNTRPEITVPFTSETGAIESRMLATVAAGRTSLFDAIHLGIQSMKKARNSSRVLFVVSDGADNSSRYSSRELLRLVREADVRIYAVGLDSPNPRVATAIEWYGSDALAELALESGGRHFHVEEARELPEVAEKIAVEIHSQYMLTYTPRKDAPDGKYRRVTVKLAPLPEARGLRAYWRPGYVWLGPVVN